MSFEAPFTTHYFEIPFDKFNEPIYLIPFGDVHRFADNCDERHWLDFIKWAETKERCFFLGMGDYDDFASTSERYALSSAKFHDTTKRYIEDGAKKRTYDFAEEIKFMKGKLIGLLEGNHHFAFSSGVTSTQLMCESLNCRYLGVSSFIRLTFRCSKGNHNIDIDIWAHHGLGAGRRAGASVNKVEDMLRVAEADIYLMGHDHHKWVDFVHRMRLGRSIKEKTVLNSRKILLGRTGSFQIGYIPNKSNYVSSFAMPPTDLGVIKIELTPKRFRGERESVEVDIHASI